MAFWLLQKVGVLLVFLWLWVGKHMFATPERVMGGVCADPFDILLHCTAGWWRLLVDQAVRGGMVGAMTMAATHSHKQSGSWTSISKQMKLLNIILFQCRFHGASTVIECNSIIFSNRWESHAVHLTKGPGSATSRCKGVMNIIAAPFRSS